jgi:hypothetical protein
MAERRIQRYVDGIDYDMISDHKLYLQSIEDGIAPHKEHEFTPLLDAQLDNIDDVIGAMFPPETSGRFEVIPNSDSVESIIMDMQVAMQRRLRHGYRTDVIFFDYAQLLDSRPEYKNTNHHEYTLSLVKDFAIRNDVHVVMSSQATKTASENQRNGKPMSTDSAQYIRSDKANQILILDRQYIKKGDSVVETPCYWLIIGKLSLAKNMVYPARIPLLMLPTRLYFLEYEWYADPKYKHIAGRNSNQSF